MIYGKGYNINFYEAIECRKKLIGHKQCKVNIFKNDHPNLRLFMECLRVRVTFAARPSFHYY